MAVGGFSLLGIPIHCSSVPDIIDLIESNGGGGVGNYVVVRDVHGLVRAVEDRGLKDIHLAAARVVPDGAPIAFLGRMAGYNCRRLTGYDLFTGVIQSCGGRNVKHFFYGGTEDQLARLREKLQCEQPQAEIVGWFAPPFRPLTTEERAAAITQIAASGANVVWVGLGTPKQELLMNDYAGEVPATFVGIGAVYDFYTDAVSRAPAWMGSMGLEWLYRLIQEPGRLWRRYLLVTPRLFLHLLGSLPTAIKPLQELKSKELNA